MGGAGTTPEILDFINETITKRGAKRGIKVGYGFSEVFGVLSVQKYENELIKADAPFFKFVGVIDIFRISSITRFRGYLMKIAPFSVEKYRC